ncbi:MAG: hypothetical protein AB7T49_17975 [Oligoflexales bacterium]
MLYLYQSVALEDLASSEFWDGVKKLGLSADHIPSLESLNKQFERLTGWKLISQEQCSSLDDFYAQVAQKRFPIIRKLRPHDQIFWAKDADFWHDVFGHVGLLVNGEISEMYLDLAQMYVEAESRLKPFIDRVFWFSAEFGFIRQKGEDRIYGAGLLPSPTAIYFIRQRQYEKLPFSIPLVLDTSYDPDAIQTKFFVIDSYRQVAKELSQWLEAQGVTTHLSQRH